MNMSEYIRRCCVALRSTANHANSLCSSSTSTSSASAFSPPHPASSVSTTSSAPFIVRSLQTVRNLTVVYSTRTTDTCARDNPHRTPPPPLDSSLFFIHLATPISQRRLSAKPHPYFSPYSPRERSCVYIVPPNYLTSHLGQLGRGLVGVAAPLAQTRSLLLSIFPKLPSAQTPLVEFSIST